MNLNAPHAADVFNAPFQLSSSVSARGGEVCDGSKAPLQTEKFFLTLLATYRLCGGLARLSDPGCALQNTPRGGLVGLTRLIESAEVFGFEWRRDLFVPMFQFDLPDLTVRPESRRVLAELLPALDPWSLAVWFGQPNSSLHGQRPLDLLDSDLPAVLEVARMDRYVERG